jgi:hypothetical protein
VIRLNDRRNMCFQLLLHIPCVRLSSLAGFILDLLRESSVVQTASLQGSASELELGT